MNTQGVSFFEKTALSSNYNKSFQDKKKIADLTKEIENLKAEIAELKNESGQLNDDDSESFKAIATVEDFSDLICQHLKTDDKIKLIALLNQSLGSEIKKVNSGFADTIKNKLGYVTARILKTRPAKKPALFNTIKTMFKNEIDDSEIENIIFNLQKRSIIKIVDNKIIYLQNP